MVNLVQLVAAVGPALIAVNDAARAPVEITGVHISELPDPTPYLEGGELLLTTGMPLDASASRTSAYVARLAQRGVRALVLGLGPIHRDTPHALTTACIEAGLPLLIVPVQHAFRTVTAAYWGLVAKDGRAGLVQQIGTQTSVVRAAAGPGGVAGVTRLVSQALGTWAGCFPFDGSEPTIWPEAAAGVIPALRHELRRFAQRGDVGAATFPLHGYDVIAYPISGEGRPVGAFVVGTTQRLSKTDRQLMLTAAAALSLRASVREDARASARSIDSALAALLADDEVTAARALAGAVGGDPLPSSVRVLAFAPARVATARGRSDGPGAAPPAVSAVADATVAELVARGLVPRSSRTRSTAVDGCLVVLVDAGEAAAGRDPSRAQPDLDAPPVNLELTGAMSEPVSLGSVRAAVVLTCRTARRAVTGRILATGDDGAPNRGEEAAARLRAYTRAPLVESVRGYIRHRGSWESVARDLGVHRNTVRSRVRVARETLGVDLDDPDLAAELWIALRDGATR